MAIFGQNQYEKGRQKYSARPITLAHDEILINGFLFVKRGTLEMQIAVSRARAIGTYLRDQFISLHL
jgi:hypothetical protein